MSGGKYVNPTGDGYLGTYASGTSVTVGAAAMEATTWRAGKQLAVLADPPKLRIIPAENLADTDEAVTTVSVCQDRSGFSLSKYLLGHIDALGENALIRVYDRPAGGLTVVPADRDPFVEEGDQ